MFGLIEVAFGLYPSIINGDSYKILQYKSFKKIYGKGLCWMVVEYDEI